MSVQEAPPPLDARAHFGEQRRAQVRASLDEIDGLEAWQPVAEIVFEVAKRTDLARALIMEALLELADEGAYSYRLGRGEPAIRVAG